MINLRKLRKIRTFGDSMYPLMKDDDLIHYRPVAFEDIKSGDIVVAQRNNLFITHRVIYKNSTSLITKGDHNLKPDHPFEEKDIVGKVYMIQRGNKKMKIEELYLLQSSVYYKEICRLNSALRKARVNFVFLKGLLLHLYYQKTYPRRVYADCDIMIKKFDKQKIENIFHNFGYKKFKNESNTSLILENSKTEINYYKSVNGIRVVFDIHLEPAFMMTKLNINHRFYDSKLLNLLTNHFLNSKHQIRIDRNQFAILQPIELVVYLALHFFHHNYRDIFRLQLIKVILEKNFSNSSWQQLGKFIIKYKIQNFVFPVFILLKDYYSVSVPKAFLSKIHPKQLFTDILMIRIKKNIFTSQNRLQAGIERFLLLFLLSLQPLFKKLGVFVNLEVVGMLFRIIYIYILSPVKKLSLKGK